MTEQQQHLQQLIDQRAQLNDQINKNKELFWKIQGAIEYLTQIGVTLPTLNSDEPIDEVMEETVEE